MAPAISGDLGKDAKEVVSLRILESLFPQTGDEAVVDADAGQNGKITFDSSERCEDVLNKILREVILINNCAGNLTLSLYFCFFCVNVADT